MLKFLFTQSLSLLATLLFVVTLVFFGMRLLPGDPASLRAGLDASPERVEAIRRSLGLDQPLIVQYGNYLAGLLRGDLGESWRQRQSVSAILLERLPVTLLLAATAYALTLLLGFGLGILAGLYAHSPFDKAVRAYTTLGLSFPEFWIGFILILLLSLHLGWFPFIGYPEQAALSTRLYHLALPALTLALPRSAQLARLTRSLVLEERTADYIRTARAKGLSQAAVARHLIANALPGTFPLAALELGGLLTGVIIVEQVFALPGLGAALLGAIGARDYAVVQGATIVAIVVFTAVNWLADLAQVLTNPRLRYRDDAP
jgi:peptide/nickel transport system permease protein